MILYVWRPHGQLKSQGLSRKTFPCRRWKYSARIVTEIESYQRVIDGARQMVASYWCPHIAVPTRLAYGRVSAMQKLCQS